MNSENSINTHSAENDFSFKSNKEFYLYSIALLGLWLVFCWQGLVSAVQIWYGNEIFNHGFFIVPGAIYLIYLKRKTLLSIQFQTSALALVVIIPALLLYVIGVAGDVQLFMHIATFTLLPALIWLMLGTQAAKTILFPLVFMLFSIPVGEQLTPYLQEIAADGSVALLQLTGIPLFRSGLFIEIPQGRFLVAEACSGVSFFIASFVIGSLYAYLNLVSVKRRIVFVSIALIFPVLANVIRVYGIILIAYWTDMEYAAGADHLIYGWFFFAFVIVCLLGIGELMRESTPQDRRLNRSPSLVLYDSKKLIKIVICVLTIMFIWVSWINHNDSFTKIVETPVYDILKTEIECNEQISHKPVLNRPTITRTKSLLNMGECNTLVVDAWFDGVGSELISSLNRFYSPSDWSRLELIDITALSREANYVFTGEKITTPNGEIAFFVTWFIIDGIIFENAFEAKLYQVYLAMVGEPIAGSFVYVSSGNIDALEKVVNQITLSFTENK